MHVLLYKCFFKKLYKYKWKYNNEFLFENAFQIQILCEYTSLVRDEKTAILQIKYKYILFEKIYTVPGFLTWINDK